MKAIFFFLIFSFFTFQLLAQNKSKVRIYTKPKESVIKLGDSTLEYGKFYELDSGRYAVKVWAPKHELTIKKFNVTTNQLKTVPVKLSYSESYKKHRQRVNWYTTKKVALKYGVAATYIFIAINSYSKVIKYNDDASRYKEEALGYKQAYESSFWPNDLTFNRERFQQSKNNYEDAIQVVSQNQQVLLYGGITAGILAYFSWKKANNLVKPEYQEEPLLSDLKISPVFNQNTSGIAISFKL